MNPTAFIAFAELIAREHREAAASRSAVSRAYYGAFHLALSLLTELGLSVDHNHGHVRHDYLNSGHPVAQHIGLLLEDLGTARVEADYRLGRERTENVAMATDCIAGAQRVDAHIQQLRAEFQNAELRQAFTGAIAAYRKKVNRRV